MEGYQAKLVDKLSLAISLSEDINTQIGKTNCLSNQLGYVFHNEHQTFSPTKAS